MNSAKNLRLMKVDRFLLSSLLRSLFVALSVAMIVLMALQLMRLSSVMIHHDLEFIFIIRMMGYLALSFTPLILPIAFLFSMLGVFSRMSSDKEFVALQAMGFSPVRVLIPCTVVGIAICILTLWCSFALGPQGNRGFEKSMDEAFKRKVSSALRSGTFSEGFLDMVIFVDQVDPSTMNLERVFIYDESNFQNPISISASQGRWSQNPTEGIGILHLYDGVIVHADDKREALQRIHFDEYSYRADFSREIGWSRDSPPSLGWSGLLQKRKEAQNDLSINARPIWTEFARRSAVSILCILLVPLCFAISFDNSRTAKGKAILSGLIVILSYWVLYFALFTWLLKTPIEFFIRKEWATYVVVWIPNMLVSAAAFYYFRKKTRIT